MKIKIINKSNFELPKYETKGSVGMDIKANINESIKLIKNKQVLIPTGLYVELPKPLIDNYTGEGYGYEIQIRPRSGLSAKHGIIVVNSPGTIDCDYRGEIKVILMNLSDNVYTVKKGDRIAQMVVNRFERVLWNDVDEINETSRNDGGFGHTGK